MLKPVLSDSDRLVVAGYVACAVIAIGSIAPWVSFAGEEVLGINDPAGVSDQVADLGFLGSDGWLTLVLAGFSAAMLWNWDQFAAREKLIGLIVMGGVAVVIPVYDLIDIVNADVEDVSAGWGLFAALIGSLGLLGISARLLRLNPV